MHGSIISISAAFCGMDFAGKRFLAEEISRLVFAGELRFLRHPLTKRKLHVILARLPTVGTYCVLFVACLFFTPLWQGKCKRRG
jgi:hypothetical protein